MVEVFKTNIESIQDAARIIHDLSSIFPDYQINFDLEDCDKILRVEATDVSIESIESFLTERGFVCQALPEN